MFFDNWHGLIRVVVVGILAYIALIFWLRITGKRTLSKWNSFDFIVTIALGSILATVILSKDVMLIEGILAFMLLIFLQFLITFTSVRSKFVRNLIKADPTMLLNKGEFLFDTMRRQRVPESEIRAAIRKSGFAAIEDVEAVVLETDGSFSVVGSSQSGSRSALEDVSSSS